MVGKPGPYFSVDKGSQCSRSCHDGNKQADVEAAGYAEAFKELRQVNDNGIQQDITKQHKAVNDP